MLNTGLSLLYGVLPLLLVLYWLLPAAGRPLVLLLASAGLYLLGEGQYILVLAAALLIGWAGGRLIACRRAGARWVLLGSVVLDGALLAVLKYGGALGLPVAPAAGMSLYILQMIGYTADVYRGEIPAERNLISFLLYGGGFPWLHVGPLIRYGEFSAQLHSLHRDPVQWASGARRLILGLGKAVILAGAMDELHAAASAVKTPSVLLSWLAVLAFLLRLYFILSGCSDAALGIAALLGFTLPENFRHPLAAESLTDFWRRCWITVGRWFHRYLLCPLRGRGGKGRTFLALLIVWAAAALWHGGGLPTLLAGLVTAVLLAAEAAGFAPRRVPVLGHIYVWLLALLGAAALMSPTLAAAGSALGGLIGLGGLPLADPMGLYLLRSFAVPLVLAAVGTTPLPAALGRLLDRKVPDKVKLWAEPVLWAALLLLCTAYLVEGGPAFPYHRF